MKFLSNPVFKIALVRTLQASLAALVLHRLCHWPLTGPHALGFLFTPGLCVYFLFVFIAPWSWGMPILTRLDTGEKVVALTFDDGPSLETTPQILDVLRDWGVSATFFVLGDAVERHPELLRRIVREGHGVGLHGCRHAPLVLASSARLRQEVQKASAIVQGVCPEAAVPRLFRPPYGFKTVTMNWLLSRAGYRLVLWSLNPRDYHSQTAEKMARNFFAGLHPGAVALLHDGPVSAETVPALPLILDGLAGMDYRCVLLEPDGGSGSISGR